MIGWSGWREMIKLVFSNTKIMVLILFEIRYRLLARQPPNQLMAVGITISGISYFANVNKII